MVRFHHALPAGVFTCSSDEAVAHRSHRHVVAPGRRAREPVGDKIQCPTIKTGRNTAVGQRKMPHHHGIRPLPDGRGIDAEVRRHSP